MTKTVTKLSLRDFRIMQRFGLILGLCWTYFSPSWHGSNISVHPRFIRSLFQPPIFLGSVPFPGSRNCAQIRRRFLLFPSAAAFFAHDIFSGLISLSFPSRLRRGALTLASCGATAKNVDLCLRKVRKSKILVRAHVCLLLLLPRRRTLQIPRKVFRLK